MIFLTSLELKQATLKKNINTEKLNAKFIAH